MKTVLVRLPDDFQPADHGYIRPAEFVAWLLRNGMSDCSVDGDAEEQPDLSVALTFCMGNTDDA